MKNNRGRSDIVIMIIVAVIALFLRILVERIIKINIAQNESDASDTLKLVCAALENYAKDNGGVFPTRFSLLTQANPAYLDKDYITKSPLKGYNYSCPRLEPSGYSCLAAPTKCNFTGKMTYTVTTGGAFVPEECSKKE